MVNRNLVPIEQLARQISKRFANAKVSIDAPRKATGVWYLDASLDGHTVIVQWQQGKGFGVSSAPEYAYGEGPDEVYPTEEATYGRVLSLLLAKAFTSPPIAVGLKQLRQELGLSQAELAEILDKQQGEVSKIERRKDVLVSTLADYVRAVGGELQIAVRLGNGQIRQLQLEGTATAQSAAEVSARR